MHSLKLVNKLHLAMKALHIRRLQLMRSLHLINRPHPGLRLIPLLREKPLEVGVASSVAMNCNELR